MKKFISSVLISFVLIINLIIPVYVIAAETVWNYNETSTNTIKGPFTSQILCVANYDKYFKEHPGAIISTCQPSTIAGKPIPDQSVTFTPKIDMGENNSVYNFLAPIAGLNKMSSVSNDPTCTEKTGCISNNIGAYLNTIFKIGIGLCAALAVIMLIINGITYMGDESIFAKTEAKSKMFSAILGLLIALGAWALLNTINPALTGKGGLNISQAVVEIENESVPWSTYEVGDNKAGCPSGFVDVATNASPSKINVCNTIAKGVSDLIAAAKASNPSLVISGSGSRSTATTQALRVKNSCPDPTTPSTQCKPNAVARPGSSNHERGLAVDFNCNGAAMGKTDIKNVCYDWLTKNAMRFSLKNNFATLQETWHWSTDGK